ncbi:phospholipid carrier-dependent glycosyltransferase [Streptomyces filamentosus]|uniref:phospholipid carrier-dependent glycosyltransferase n=1 Tax=Streptomyces filamentosus TaxID=67294 RepID=UPI0033E2C5F1
MTMAVKRTPGAGAPDGVRPVAAVRTPVLRRPVVRVRLLAGAALVLTAALRLVGVRGSGDLFIDELIYREIGVHAVGGGFPRTDDGLFFLHPPGFFSLQAGWALATGTGSDVVSGIYAFRELNALLAGVTAALLVLLVARARSLPLAGAAALLFALDPYLVRQNDRVMLDTAAVMWVLAGYLVLLPLTARPQPRPSLVRGRACAAGLLFSLALLTKDHTALIVLLPLLLGAALGRGLPRRELLRTAAVAVVPYGLYVLAVAAAGHFDLFWSTKTHGVRRLLGIVQETGFNAGQGPPLTSRLAEELSTFGPTYVLLLLGVPALVVLLRRGDPRHLLLALFQLSAGFTLVYAFAFGTLEEQALYLLVVPNLVAVAVACPRLPGRPPRRRGRLRAAACAGAGAVLVVSTVFSGLSYARVRSEPDTGFAQLRAYLAAHVPPGTALAAADGRTTRGVTEWALKDHYRVGTWVTPEDRAAAGARYVVVPWKLVRDGYARLDAPAVERLVAPGRLLFSVDGRTYGTLALYLVPLPGGPPSPPGGPVPPAAPRSP